MKDPKPLHSSRPHKAPALGFAGPFALHGAKCRRRANPGPSQAPRTEGRGSARRGAPPAALRLREMGPPRAMTSARPCALGVGWDPLGQEAPRLR